MVSATKPTAPDYGVAKRGCARVKAELNALAPQNLI
jgi:hypothetical protein